MANIRKKVNKGGAVWPAGGRGNFRNFSKFGRGHPQNLNFHGHRFGLIVPLDFII